MKTLIIAEAGVNHNGSIDLAKKLIEAAAAAGADYVKFQTFRAAKLVSKDAIMADYQKKNTGSDSNQYAMLKALELSYEDHLVLIEHCNKNKIAFLSTAFDLESIDLLLKLGINLFKIPSGELTNLPFLKKIAALHKKIILSSGMATMAEVTEAINALEKGGTPKENITLLHCTTEYPAPYNDVNLLAMQSMAKELAIKVGYSDHTAGIEIPIAAVALGAQLIEKHFTLDRNLPGPDHKASLEPNELTDMVRAIRNVEVALGDGVKRVAASEQKNIAIARKSIHLLADCDAGKIITEADLEMKRPGDGISPMRMNEVIGKRLKKAMAAESKLSFDDFE